MHELSSVLLSEREECFAFPRVSVVSLLDDGTRNCGLYWVWCLFGRGAGDQTLNQRRNLDIVWVRLDVSSPFAPYLLPRYKLHKPLSPFNTDHR